MTSNLPPHHTALLVIDVQQSFLHRAYWSDAELPRLQNAILRLDAGSRARGIPVVHVLHSDDDGPFRMDSGWVKPMDWLPGDPAATFIKHVHNAFTDTGLDTWLRKHGVQRLIVCGIRTEQCCETTTRVASDLGYAVDFVTEATLTFAMTHPRTGQVFSPEDIATRTELVLAGRFARITTVDESLEEIGV